MSAEETVTYNIVYNVQGINESVRGTQRLLFFANALRLSVKDIQQVMSGPTLSNVLWTTIQLSRAWTAFYRIVKATNQEQSKAGVSGALRGALSSGGAGGVARGLAGGQQTLRFGPTGDFFGISNPPNLGIIASLAWTLGIAPTTLIIGGGTVLLTVGALYLNVRHQELRRADIGVQRDIARNQGLEF